MVLFCYNDILNCLTNAHYCIYLFISSFVYNEAYYKSRRLAHELGVGDSNDWVYEEDDDWVS